jgi:hypothetical protein
MILTLRNAPFSLTLGTHFNLQSRQSCPMIRSLLACVLLLVLIAGCGGGRAATDYVPQAERAKQALTLALDAWKSGQLPDPAGKLPSGQSVKAVDMDWSEGQKLTSYEIVREIPGEATGPRKFIVKLTTIAGPAAEVTYFIVGIDPIQVFRDKDYERYFEASK